jgi:hypothetical protein
MRQLTVPIINYITIVLFVLCVCLMFVYTMFLDIYCCIFGTLLVYQCLSIAPFVFLRITCVFYCHLLFQVYKHGTNVLRY